jgi:hypothetical protein
MKIKLWKPSEDGKTGKVRFIAFYHPGLVVSREGDWLHGVVKDSVEAAVYY